LTLRCLQLTLFIKCPPNLKLMITKDVGVIRLFFLVGPLCLIVV